MPQQLPAISLVAVPGRGGATLEIAREVERRGFAGIYMPSRYGNMAQCAGLACHRAHPVRHLDRADLRAHGRGLRAERRLYPRGLGRAVPFRHRRQRTGRCTSASASRRESRSPTSALSSRSSRPTRASARCRRSCSPRCASGWSRSPARSPRACVLANAPLAHGASLAHLPAAKRADPDFFIGNMIPTCISRRRREAAAARQPPHAERATRCCRTTATTGRKPATTRRWQAIETAIAEGRGTTCRRYLTDRWLADCTLYGARPRCATGSRRGTPPASARRSSCRRPHPAGR